MVEWLTTRCAANLLENWRLTCYVQRSRYECGAIRIQDRQDQLAEAVAAPKCHKCGCLHKTVEALSGTAAGKNELAPILAEARSVFVRKQYDCLGCPVCFPAIAANAFAEAYPDVAGGLDLCPTEEPDERGVGHHYPESSMSCATERRSRSALSTARLLQ